MNAPSGTVTFLFSDIEGSTLRWEQNAPVMSAVLARHDAVMREAIASNRGHVFKTVGDAFCAVFQRADDAIKACLDAQRALASIDTPPATGGPIRVRMALHTGETEERDNDYFGPALNLVARLLSAGHGEQVLVSSTTRGMAERWLPPELQLQDLGFHRLRDLSEPERVYQLCHAQLRSAFPPLRSSSPRANNFPRELSSFVGREEELGALRALVGSSSLLTLTGSGGCGKTRLALRLAQSVLGSFPDGAGFAALGPLTDPALVPAELLRSLGLRETPGQTITETLTAHLAHKSMLLVLDGCEHLLAACAHLVGEILQASAHLKVIATSREPLGVGGEKAHRVPSLSLPPDMDGSFELEQLSGCESVALFVERARAAKSDFALNLSNGSAVARICRRLDGIPLAIELAAVRVKVLTVQQIDARLDDRFRLLTGGARSGLMRHQTLHAAIAWSYGMLTQDEKSLLRALSVFAGGCTLESALAVCFPHDPPPDEYEVLDLLGRLVDKSLVALTDAGGQARYGLLDTVREFARQESVGVSELESTRQRHLAYFSRLAEQVEPKLTGPEQALWLARLDQERENLLTAMEWSKQLADTGEMGMRLAGAIWRFWEIRGYLSIGLSTLKDLIKLSVARGAVTGAVLAKALNTAGSLALGCGDYEEARELLERALAMRESLGDQKGTADSSNSLGLIDWRQGNYAAARARFERGLTIRRAIADMAGIAALLNNVGLLAMEQGDYADARARFEEALAINRKQGNRAWVAAQLNNLGNVMISLGEPEAARKYFGEALAINREVGNRAWMVTNLGGLGEVNYQVGDYAAARQLHEQSLRIAREVGDKEEVAEELRHLARVARVQGNMQEAAALCGEAIETNRASGSRPAITRCFELLASLWGGKGPERAQIGAELLGAAAALRESIGQRLPPSDEPDVAAAHATCRDALGPAAFDAAVQRGVARLRADGWERIADDAIERIHG